MTDYKTLWRIGQDYKEKGFYSIAIELFLEAIKFCQDVYMLRDLKLMLADSLRIIKRWEEAINIYYGIEEYGTIGNIKLYLGDIEEAVNWFEKVNLKKGYIYYKYPEALFLLGKYSETLDAIFNMYTSYKYFETNYKCLSRKNLEFLFLCFDKAYDFHNCLNSSINDLSDQEITGHFEKQIFNSNQLSFRNHSKLLNFLIKEYGNVKTAIVYLEKISKDDNYQKVKNRISKIYTKSIWCLEELDDRSLYCPFDLLQKIIRDIKFAKLKLDDINDNLNLTSKKFYDWRTYIKILCESRSEIKGEDIFYHFNYFMPRSSLSKLFPNETIKYVDDQIKCFKNKSEQTISSYLFNFDYTPSEFYSQSDKVMNQLLSKLNDDLRIVLNIPSPNEKWIKEFAMVRLISQIFTGYEIITQASPDWLKPQRLDLLIPSLALAVEYQGEQHFKPVEIFGGEEGFKQNQERDERKRKLCEANGIRIEYINYDQDILERVKEIYFQYSPIEL